MKTMDMIKITKEMIPEVKTVVLKDMIEVKQHIPYEQKEIMALEYVTYINNSDDTVGVMFDSYKRELIELVLICKYYTNIDITSLDGEEGMMMLHDWIMANDLYDAIHDAVFDDYYIVEEIANDMKKHIRAVYDAQNSIGYKAKKVLGPLLETENIVDALAKSEEVNNTMVDLIGAYNKQKEAEATKPAKKQKLDSGLVVNFAKKKK